MATKESDDLPPGTHEHRTTTRDDREAPAPTLEERRLRLEELRLALEHSFARKWLPTLATIMVGLIAGMFGYVQQHAATEETERVRQASVEETARARIDAEAKDKREWGFKIVDMFFDKRDLFDLTKNPDAAESNLRVLVAVAPTAVQGVLNAERSKIPPPSSLDDTSRTYSLAAAAAVQDALTAANPMHPAAAPGVKPSDFTVYVQYSRGDREVAVRAQSALIKWGYRVPGIQEVDKVPSRLQVRYYRSDQKPNAGQLADQLGKILSLSAGPDNAILVTSSRQLPGGILELWLPHEAH
jgi:hypothetical protein